MQRAEGQVAGFGDAQRRFDGFQITHFADQHDIRVFTKSGAQSVCKTLRIGVQLALIDHAIFVHVHKLDRILNGEDVVVALAVDLVDHGCERGRLARTGWSSDQHQAARLIEKFADHRRQAKLVKRLNFKGNETKNSRSRAALVENVGAEAGKAL